MVRALFCLQPRKKSPLFWALLNLWDIGVALILRGTKERNRTKRLTKDSDFKSPQAEQVGEVQPQRQVAAVGGGSCRS